jgi:hypothetical protein
LTTCQSDPGLPFGQARFSPGVSLPGEKSVANTILKQANGFKIWFRLVRVRVIDNTGTVVTGCGIKNNKKRAGFIPPFLF